MTGPRYAIYFAPEDDTALSRFGWPWLGRRPDSADDAAFAPSDDHASFVTEPRLYGLHATLKPPFFMAGDKRLYELTDALRTFSAAQRAVEASPLQLNEIDGFLALRPSGDTAALDVLAAACVTQFDRFRAPATADDIAKRAARGLTARQHELLLRWGYPYLLEEFRFHVTLTGRLNDEDRARLQQRLIPLVAEVRQEPLRIRSLCLFEQRQAGERFLLKERYPLAG